MTGRRFDLLIFDWDGTLLDSVDWIVTCLQRAAGESGLPVPAAAAARAVVGLSLERALNDLFPHLEGERRALLMRLYRQHFFSRPLTTDDLFGGVADMLTELRDAGYRLAIATGKARRGLDHALSQTGLGKCFEVTCCADETASKPDPTMLREILSVTGVPRRRAVMIGDSVHDLTMAANAGLAAIAVASGAHSADELAALAPLICLSRVAELPAIMRSLGSGAPFSTAPERRC